MTDPTTANDARWFSRLGVTARSAGLAAWIAFFLPWCGQLRGVDLARGDAYHRLYAVPALATLLLIAPFVARRGWRWIAEGTAAAALLLIAAYVGSRVGRLRGLGIFITAAAGVTGMLGAIAGAWLDRRSAQSAAATTEDGTPLAP